MEMTMMDEAIQRRSHAQADPCGTESQSPVAFLRTCG